jgi:sterol desaturase/sphingolipid hydroxylase (fatty acid hydroxylase superfamily)
VLFAFVAIQILRNAQGHSGIEFYHHKWVYSPMDIFTDTTHHDLENQKVKGNYGLYFTWWDRIMGTELPEYKEEFRRIVQNAGNKDSADLKPTN